MKLIRIALSLLVSAIVLNACQKEYSSEGGSIKLPSGTWQFNDSSKLLLGNMDSAIVSSTGNLQELHLYGTSLDGSQSFNMQIFADTLKAGTYKASLFQSVFNYTGSAKTLYQAGQLTGGEFTVIITSFSATSVTGTFSGTAIDSSGKAVQLTAGKFTSTIGGTVTPGVSVGMLGDSSGTCTPVVLNGTYTQGIALTASNTVQAQVTVTALGSYTISTNTVNGVTFSKTGSFTNLGVQNVLLTGYGAPVNAGSQTFTLLYGTSQCSFSINFGKPATGTLGGEPSACTQFSIAGVYQQGIVLNTTNTVKIQVTATTPGNYNITTNTSNGVLFSQSGSFATAGVYPVTLVGSGTPVDSGTHTFSVSFGTSTCTFSITFLPGVKPSGDYFPVTAGSYWIYGSSLGDSLRSEVLNYTPNFGGKIYSTLGYFDQPPTAAFDSSYYRKPGGDYYEYLNYSDYFDFDEDVSGEFIFLKDNQSTGYMWTSPTIAGNSNGVLENGYIQMTILENDVQVTLGAFVFPDVIKVKYEYIKQGSIVETDQRWFAKDVGEIYENIDGSEINQIANWQVF